MQPVETQQTSITPRTEKDIKITATKLHEEKVRQVFLRKVTDILFAPWQAAGGFLREGTHHPVVGVFSLIFSAAFACVGVVTSLFGLPIYYYRKHLEQSEGRAINLNDSFATIVTYKKEDLEKNFQNSWIDASSYKVLAEIITQYNAIMRDYEKQKGEIESKARKLYDTAIQMQKHVKYQPAITAAYKAAAAAYDAAVRVELQPIADRANLEIQGLKILYNKYVEAKKFTKESHIDIALYLANYDTNLSEWVKNPHESAAKIPTVLEFLTKKS